MVNGNCPEVVRDFGQHVLVPAKCVLSKLAATTGFEVGRLSNEYARHGVTFNHKV